MKKEQNPRLCCVTGRCGPLVLAGSEVTGPGCALSAAVAAGQRSRPDSAGQLRDVRGSGGSRARSEPGDSVSR